MFTIFYGNLHDIVFSGRYGPTDGLERIQYCRMVIRKAENYLEMIERGDLQPDANQQKRIDSLPQYRVELEEMLKTSPADAARNKMRSFLPAYLAIVDFGHLHLFYDMDGFHFFPADRATYLSIQYFVNMLQTKFDKNIESTAFLFDGHLVWSNFDEHKMRLIYKFLRVREQEAAQRARAARVAAKKAADRVAKSGKSPTASSASPGSKASGGLVGADAGSVWSTNDTTLRSQPQQGAAKAAAQRSATASTTGFMTKGRHLVSFVEDRGVAPAVGAVCVPQLFVDSNSADKDQRLLVYHQDRVTLVMLVSNVHMPDTPVPKAMPDVQPFAELNDLCQKVELFAGAELRQLAAMIHEQAARGPGSSSTGGGASSSNAAQGYRFLYFNHMNLALKISGIRWESSHTRGKVGDLFSCAHHSER
jgi:hypothetical protein